MFKKTTITMTLAAIATVAVNVQAPVFAAEPSSEPVISETPGLPAFGSFTETAPTLEEALEDYLAGLGPEEGDFGGPAELAVLPDDVLDAITDPTIDLPGVGELPPLTIDEEDTPIDELVCGERGAICDEPDEGAELPLDPTDVCGEEGTACDLTPGFGDEEAPAEHPWDVPLGDDEEPPFDDHGWVEPDHDEASYATSVGTGSPVAATEIVTTTTVGRDAVTTNDSAADVIDGTSELAAEVGSALATPPTDGTDGGIDPTLAAAAGILAVLAVAGIGYGAFRMGRNGG
jgi:hypothetical protein